MTSFFKDFFTIGKFESLNATFLALIPKRECYLSKKFQKGSVEDFKRYRSTSLEGGLHELLAKILASRLKRIASKVKPKFHNTFVGGRQIINANFT